MTSLITLMRQRYPTDAHAAALLGISRQAYSQAIKRNRLSNETALRCADLLGIDRAAALLANCPAAEHMPAPVIHPAPDTPPEVHITRTDNTNYANNQSVKKGANRADNCLHTHDITSQDQKEAVDLIRWVFAVANIRADSPRFAYYVSRWRVPEKIATAKKAGTFKDIIANCPPIDPAWIRFVPDALKAYRDFITPSARPPDRTPRIIGQRPTITQANPPRRIDDYSNAAISAIY